MTPQQRDSDDLLDSVSSSRGYSLPLHEVLAEHDPEVLAGYEQMMRSLYLGDRRLDGKTKEFVYVAVLVALGAAEEHIRAHMKKAVREGATKDEVLEAVELVVPAAGVARANVGFDIWRRTFR
jgi:alkylhydroperoxidase/carboxymuconolactone decarboxylase family protein YurZ